MSFVSAMSAILFLSLWYEEPIWTPAGRALRQSGRQGSEAGAEHRTEQPAIHMDQVDRLSINGLPLESKTPAQAREELLREIRIPAAIQVSLYVFAACYSSIFLPQPTQPETESLLWGDLYTCIMYWVESIVDRFLEYNWVSVDSDVCKAEIRSGWRDWLGVKTKCCCELFLHDFCGSRALHFLGSGTEKRPEQYRRRESSAKMICQSIDWSINR